MVNLKSRKPSVSRDIAYISVTSALLTGGQFVFSFVVGVEIVTLILAGFSFTFGARRGALCAVTFSLLRCLVFGFYPTVMILYLIYYPLLALVFGLLGRLRDFTGASCAAAVNIMLIAVCAGCAALYFLDAIKIAAVYAVTVKVLLWVIFALGAGLLITYDVVFFTCIRGRNEILKVILLAGAGAVMTAVFTLTDDIITPLFWGYSRLTALAYFYSSFTAMLPQMVCTVVSVCTLFLPVTAVFERAAQKNNRCA